MLKVILGSNPVTLQGFGAGERQIALVVCIPGRIGPDAAAASVLGFPHLRLTRHFDVEARLDCRPSEKLSCPFIGRPVEAARHPFKAGGCMQSWIHRPPKRAPAKIEAIPIACNANIGNQADNSSWVQSERPRHYGPRRADQSGEGNAPRARNFAWFIRLSNGQPLGRSSMSFE